MNGRLGLGLTMAMIASAGAIVAQSAQPRVDVSLRADRISIEEIARVFPALGDLDLPPTIRITEFDAEGPLNKVTVRFAAESASGGLTGRLVVDAMEPQRTARGSLQLRGVALADLLDRPDLPDALTADASFDLRLDAGKKTVHGTFEVSVPEAEVAGYAARSIRATGRIDGDVLAFNARALAYGASVRADGRVSFGDAVSYAVSGSASGVSLERLPRSLGVPRAASNLAFDYRIAGSTTGLTGRVVLAASDLAGARLARGTEATFDTRGRVVEYQAKGAVSDLDLVRIGEAFDIEALASPRYASRLAARFDVAGRGTALESATLDVRDSTIFGGRIAELTARVSPRGGDQHVVARGRFADLAPGVMLQRPDLDGRLSGTVDATGRIPRVDGALAASALDLQGSLVLDRSSIEGLPITEGTIAATLTDGTRLQIDRAELAAGETRARVSGVYGVTPVVATSLQYHLTTPSIESLTDLIGQPLRGEATIEGRVTGHDPLRIEGTLSAPHLEYQTVEADAVSARYAASVPRSDPAAADVDAHLETGKMAIGDQAFDAVAADARYGARQVTFSVDASHPMRSIDAAGELRILDEGQELRLSRLALATPDAEWRLVEGARPVVRYEDSQLAVQDLRLAAAPDQTLAISGGTREADAPLTIDADNVQLAAFAPWMGAIDLSGQLDADATVRGDLSSPTVEATFEATGGSVRGVAYQSIGGRANYDADTIGFDVRLVQPDASWLSAEGRVPTAALTSAEARATAEIDALVQSSPIDLGIVQGFTDAVTEVGGTMQIDAVVRGTLAEPRLKGQIAIRGGAFSLPAMGTRYTGLETTVLLQPDAVVVDNARLVDDDQDWVSVSGRLPVHVLASGDVSLNIEAESFEVVDNAFADLEMNGSLRVTGRLTEPDITGTIEFVGGRVNVDEILALAGADDDVYATEAARPAEAAEIKATAAEPAGMLTDVPLTLDVQLTAPALLLAGTDIKGAGDSPVGLGAVNLTARGDVELTKSREGPLNILGVIETVRGTYEFQGREFTLARGGSIRFTGGREINPILDVTATRTIAAVDTQVHVAGTLQKPQLRLASQPPLDQADILSLIVFNRPAMQLGAGEQVSLAQRATALASGFLAGELTEALSDAVGLDVIEVEAESTTGGVSPVVTVGEQLGDFYLRFKQQAGGEAQSEVVVEYEVTDWFRVQSSFVNQSDSAGVRLRRAEGSGVDAVFSFEYGGAKKEEAQEAAESEETPPEAAAKPRRRPRPR